MRTSVLIIGIFFFLCSMGSAATIHVPGDHPTIQAAIDAASGGDTIVVVPGTYTENIDFKGKAVSVISDRDGDPATEDFAPLETVINGNQAGSVATFASGEGIDSVLVGFTLTNGCMLNGGGIHCLDSAPTISMNIVIENRAEEYGGGIYCQGADALITYNFIARNKARGGAGIHCASSSAVVEGNTLTRNRGEEDGGGLCLHHSGGAVCGNWIVENWSHQGAGIYCRYDSAPVMENNFLVLNRAGDAGGGIHLTDISSPVSMRNNTIYGNTAANFCGGICCLRCQGSVTIVNTILWNNRAPAGKELWFGESSESSTVRISHCDLQGGMASVLVDAGCNLAWGDGMIDADPLLVSPAEADFHLLYTSPCRDTGDFAAAPAADFEGDPRNAADMGADEFHDRLYYTGHIVPGGSIEGKILGTPGSNPVGLFFGSGLLDAPLPSTYIPMYLEPPVFLAGTFGPIPADGLVRISATLPTMEATYFMQAVIRNTLSNLCVMEVK